MKPSSFKRSSPIIFPSASPKLCTSPSEKIPEAKSWQEIVSDSRHSPNMFGYEDNVLGIKERYNVSTTTLTISNISDTTESSDISWNDDDLLSTENSDIQLMEEKIHMDNPHEENTVQGPVIERSKEPVDTTKTKMHRSIGFGKSILLKVKKATVGI